MFFPRDRIRTFDVDTHTAVKKTKDNNLVRTIVTIPIKTYLHLRTDLLLTVAHASCTTACPEPCADDIILSVQQDRPTRLRESPCAFSAGNIRLSASD